MTQTTQAGAQPGQPQPGFVRFIYAYFWKGTRKAVYVGSAWNPAQRDRAHSKGDSLPFHRFLAKHGREKFTHRIVEALRADTQAAAWAAAVARENQWMDVLHTWHTSGGMNHQRAAVLYDTQENYVAWRAANAAANTWQAYKQLVLPEKEIVRLYRRGRGLRRIAHRMGTGSPPGGTHRVSRIRAVLIRAGVFAKGGRCPHKGANGRSLYKEAK